MSLQTTGAPTQSLGDLGGRAMPKPDGAIALSAELIRRQESQMLFRRTRAVDGAERPIPPAAFS